MLTEERNTEFPTGNLDSFLNELNTPKQDMNIEQSSVLDETIPDDSQMFTQTPHEETDDLKLDDFTSESAAEMLVGIIDTALPAGLAWLAKGETTDFQAEKDQKRTLTKSFKRYLDTKGLDLPPGWLLLFLVLTIYGVKVPTALAMRKEYNEESERQKTIDSQNVKIAQQQRLIEQLRNDLNNKTTEETTTENE